MSDQAAQVAFEAYWKELYPMAPSSPDTLKEHSRHTWLAATRTARQQQAQVDAALLRSECSRVLVGTSCTTCMWCQKADAITRAAEEGT